MACRGYRITTPLGRVAGVATDLGYVSDEVPVSYTHLDVYKRQDPDAAGSYGYWDETEASYAGTVEQLKQQAKEQLSGSALVGGAAVTEVRAELEGKIEESGENLDVYKRQI